MGYQDDYVKEHYQFIDTFLPPFFFFNLGVIERRVQNGLLLGYLHTAKKGKKAHYLDSFQGNKQTKKRQFQKL